MKLPNDAAQAVFSIGERKFALFLSFALVEVEDHELETGLLFRPGEVSCISYTPDNQEPFDLATAHLQPVLIEASSIDEAAASVADQIKTVGSRVFELQGAEAEGDSEADAEGEDELPRVCCGKPEACENGEPTDDCKPA